MLKKQKFSQNSSFGESKLRLRHFGCFLLILGFVFFASCQSTQQSSPEPAAPPPSQPEEPQPQPSEQAEPQPAPAPQRQEEFPPPKESGGVILDGARTHRVVWGDTLSRIAIRYYGRENGYYYPLIILGNPGVTVNPDLILPGTQLKIPDLQRNLDNGAARADLKAYMEELIVFYNRKPDRVMSANLRSLADKL
jgi:phage tail protein X